MAKFNIDFTEAKEFVMCEKGEQNFKITNAELKDYKNKEGATKQKIELTCEVFGGESSGSKVFHSVFVNPTSLFMFLNKLGVKVEKKAYNLDTNTFVGKTFIANVDHEKANNGNVYARIVESSIRKYVDVNTTENTPDSLSDDAFSDFATSIEISDEDLSF